MGATLLITYIIEIRSKSLVLTVNVGHLPMLGSILHSLTFLSTVAFDYPTCAPALDGIHSRVVAIELPWS